MENWAIGAIEHAFKQMDQFDSHEKFCRNLDNLKFGNPPTMLQKPSDAT
jgi:hypothetical protein